MVAAPIVIGERAWGAVSVYAGTRARFDADDVAFVRALANVCAAAIEREAADATTRAERERLEMALAAGGFGTWEVGLPGTRITMSERGAELLGVGEPGPVPVREYLRRVVPEDRPKVLDALRRLMTDGGVQRVEHRIRRPDGSLRWLEVVGRMQTSSTGTRRLVGLLADVTEARRIDELRRNLLRRERAARRAAERAREQVALLADLGAALGRVLDERTAARVFADGVTGRLCDVCVVEVTDADDAGAPLEVASVASVPDIDGEDLLRRLRSAGRWPAEVALGSRRPVLWPDVPVSPPPDAGGDADLTASAGGEQQDRASVVAVPLLARGRALGTVTMVTARGGRRLSGDDAALAVAAAERLAYVIDTARLLAERTSVARTLQRMLLPPTVPVAAGLEIAARYRSAMDVTELSGDFYDVFPSSAGGWWLVLGDVSGKGVEAAVLTGTVRNVIRTLAMRSRRPARVLARTNASILDRVGEDQFCTAVLVHLEPGDDAAGAWSVRVASAGHPPPVVVPAAGPVRLEPLQGTVLGVLERPPLEEREMVLEPGDGLVLYTDGVTEARAPGGFLGTGGLLGAVESGRAAGAEGIVRSVLAAVVDHTGGRRTDDVAVLAVRVPAPPPDGP